MARSSSATDAVPARSMIVRDADVAGNPSTRTRSMSSSRRVVWTVHGPAAPRLDRADVSSMGSRPNPSKPWSAAAARWETSAVEPRSSTPAISCCSHVGGEPPTAKALGPSR